MNDLDVLTERLERLGRTAPVPAADPSADIHRGRMALRRRRVRWAGGAATLVVAGAAVGVVASSTPGSSVAHDPADRAAAQPTRTAAPASTDGLRQFCARNELLPAGQRMVAGHRVVRHRHLAEAWNDPAVAPSLEAYRAAAADVLDPSGAHLDRTTSNIQFGCTHATLQVLGTKLGWRSGPGLGDVAIEVSRPGSDNDISMAHDGWTPYTGALPAGITSARVVDDAGGHAVVARRADGLTVGVDAEGVWGNNAAPGSPAATDLPGVQELLTLAAKPELVVP